MTAPLCVQVWDRSLTEATTYRGGAFPFKAYPEHMFTRGSLYGGRSFNTILQRLMSERGIVSGAKDAPKQARDGGASEQRISAAAAAAAQAPPGAVQRHAE